MSKEILTGAAGDKLLLLGNEAIVRGAIEAGVGFVSCYPGTPSSEVPDTFFRLSKDGDYAFEYSSNEKVALEVAAGAALAGALSLCTMKHVGLNVAADPLMTLAYVSSPGGLVILSADDPGCHSSQNEQDNRLYARLAGVPCLEPATAQECKDVTRLAFEMSRQAGHPVLLRTTTRVNHVRAPVTLGKAVKKAEVKTFARDQRRHMPIPAFARPMHLDLLSRLEGFRRIAETTELNRESGQGRIGCVASGISRVYLHDVLLEHGLTDAVRVLELGMAWPLPEDKVAAFLSGCDTVVILEELEPLLENDVRVLAQKRGLSVRIVGKGEFLPRNGEYSTEIVARAVFSVLGRELAPADLCPATESLPTRPPNLCAGCPHRATFHAVRAVFGDEAIYSSDIGCYTLGLLPPFSAGDFLFCMGSSISAGSGFARVSGQTVVALIGDSTFFHSGITGLINAIYNDHDLVVVILDNRTTAMTGHQPHPGVDDTVFGVNPTKVDLKAVIRGCGLEPVVVNPLNHKAVTSALADLKDKKGVRVLVAESPCPLHDKRVGKARKRPPARVKGDPDKCLATRDALACPAFVMEGGVFSINQAVCTGCMYCVQLSPEIKAGGKES